MKKLAFSIVALAFQCCGKEEPVSWHVGPLEAALQHHLDKCPETRGFPHVLLSQEPIVAQYQAVNEILGVHIVLGQEKPKGDSPGVFIDTPYAFGDDWGGTFSFEHAKSYVTCPSSVAVRKDWSGWRVSVPEILWQSDCDFSDL